MNGKRERVFGIHWLAFESRAVLRYTQGRASMSNEGGSQGPRLDERGVVHPMKI